MNWAGDTRTGTAEHKQWRTDVLKRDKGACQIKRPGCKHRATEADHIVPVAEGGPTTLDNGQAACHPCHVKKTAEEATRGRKRNA